MSAYELTKTILKDSANLKACVACGKEVKKYKSDSVSTFNERKYCSHRCYTDARTGTHKTTPIRICKQCGVEFVDRRYRKTYCSTKCWCKSRIKGDEFYSCVVCGKTKRRIFSQDHANKYCSRLCFNSIKGNLRPPTNIEVIVYDHLVSSGIKFETQKVIDDKFCVDFYIPESKTVIEADGKYWHGLEKTIKKDRAENAYLKSRGYNLIRLTENEIMDGSFEEKI